MNDAVQPSCAPSGSRGEIRFEPLGEDLRPATISNTPEPTDAERNDDLPASDRQIRQSARVSAVQPR
jgi:hypothetical protein